MHPMAARALITIHLSPDERKRLRVYEKSLPPGRYLQGFELCRMFHLALKTVPERDSLQMEDLWGRWGRTELAIEQRREDQDRSIIPRSKQEEIHAWEDWALDKFVESRYPDEMPPAVA